MTYPMQPPSALGSIQTGSTPLTSEDSFWGGDYPFVKPAELDQSLPITSAPRTLSEDGAAQSRLLQEGAVMVCESPRESRRGLLVRQRISAGQCLWILRPPIYNPLLDGYKAGVLIMCVYRDWETDRKSTRLNSSHSAKSRMPSSA